MPDDNPLPAYADRRPIPDPTTLTTEQLNRAVQAVREVLEAQIQGQREKIGTQREIIEARLDGMDKAIELIQRAADRVPTDAQNRIEHLKTVTDEVFRSIQRQFQERDTRYEQGTKANNAAVEAAFQAGKELAEQQNKSSALAISKSEAATEKQITSLSSLVHSETRALKERLDDGIARLTLIEGRGQGMHGGWMILIGAVSMVSALIAIFFALQK